MGLREQKRFLDEDAETGGSVGILVSQSLFRLSLSRVFALFRCQKLFSQSELIFNAQRLPTGGKKGSDDD